MTFLAILCGLSIGIYAVALIRTLIKGKVREFMKGLLYGLGLWLCLKVTSWGIVSLMEASETGRSFISGAQRDWSSGVQTWVFIIPGGVVIGLFMLATHRQTKREEEKRGIWNDLEEVETAAGAFATTSTQEISAEPKGAGFPKLPTANKTVDAKPKRCPSCGRHLQEGTNLEGEPVWYCPNLKCQIGTLSDGDRFDEELEDALKSFRHSAQQTRPWWKRFFAAIGTGYW